MHYDVVTGISSGGDASSFSYSRVETPWVYVPNPAGRPELVAADVNGDARPDFVALAHGPGGLFPVEVLTAQTKPDGTLTLGQQTVPTSISGAEKMVTFGDVNGDGRDDMLVASRGAPGVGPNCPSALAYPHVMLTRIMSAADGTFVFPAALNDCATSTRVAHEWSPELGSHELYSSDTNGDGLADFLLAFDSPVQGAVTLHDNVSVGPGLDTNRWIPADVTGDGLEDLVYPSVDGNQNDIASLIQQDDGSFAYATTHIAPDVFRFGRPVIRDWKLTDVNGDGRADFVYVHCVGTLAGGTGCILEVEALVSNATGGWTQRRPQQ